MKTVLFFESDSCTKCHQVKPLFADYAHRHGVEVQVVNADSDMKSAAAYGVMGFPTILGLRDGMPVSRLEPSATWMQMRTFIEEMGA